MNLIDNARALLAELQAHGVGPRPGGNGVLWVRLDRITEDQRRRLNALKPQVLALLIREEERKHRDRPINQRLMRQALRQHISHCPACITASRGHGLHCGAGTALLAAQPDPSKRTRHA